MTIDTTVTNGRFVGPEGVSEHAISIHDGIVRETVEHDDVWRTIDASGHLVLPGMIQPEGLAERDLLQVVQQGSTVVMPLLRHNDAGPAVSTPIDLLRWIDLDTVGSARDLARLMSSRHLVYTTDVPRPDLGQALSGGILRVGAGREGIDDWNWVDLQSNKLVVPAQHPDGPALARDGHALLEIAVSSLMDDNASRVWDLVADESVPVHVTHGGITNFPLLQFLYHEGCEERAISPSQIAAVVSANPACWYGLSPDKGSFLPGSHGDVVVFDPTTPDPYRDSPWPGRVILSIQRGNVLLYNGQLHTSPGDGLLLKR